MKKVLKKAIIMLLCVSMFASENAMCVLAAGQGDSVIMTEEPVIAEETQEDEQSEEESQEISDEQDNDDVEEDKAQEPSESVQEEENSEKKDDGEEQDNDEELSYIDWDSLGDSSTEDKEQKRQVWVHYDANAIGDTVLNMPESMQVYTDETVNLPDTIPSREGYIFEGWNEDVSGFGEFYYAGDTYKVNHDITFFAQWRAEGYKRDVHTYGNVKSKVDDQQEEITLQDETLLIDYDLPENNTAGESYNPTNAARYAQEYCKKPNGNSACPRLVSNALAYGGLNFSEYQGTGDFIRALEATGLFKKYQLAIDGQELCLSKNVGIIAPGDVISFENSSGTMHVAMISKIENDVVYMAQWSVNDYVNNYANCGELHYIGTYDSSRRRNSTYIWHFCDHSRSNILGADGCCVDCKEFLTDRVKRIDSKTAYYSTLNDKVYARQFPYEGARAIDISPKGSQVLVVGKVINGLGNQWYEVVIGGHRMYIYEQRVKYNWVYTGFMKFFLCFYGRVVSTTPEQGKPFVLSGVIQTKNSNVTKVAGRILNSSGKQVATVASGSIGVYDTQSSNDLPPQDLSASSSGGVSTYRLAGSGLEKAVQKKLEQLPANQNYKLMIDVTTDAAINGKTVNTIDAGTFYLKKSTQIASPTISPSSTFIGGVRYTITQNATGTTLYYSTNGGASYASTTQKSVTVELRNSTTIFAYSNDVSNKVSRWVDVPKISTPIVSFYQHSQGSKVSINAESGCNVYYRINSGAFSPYYGAFDVTSNCTVSAYAERSGSITSDYASENITVSKPDRPSISLITASDIGEGDAVSIVWSHDAKAGQYKISIDKDGTIWKTDTITADQYTFNTDNAGTYRVSIMASNIIGNSDISNTLSVVAHEPSTVTFVDYDGTLISKQLVAYGRDAVKPATPSRRGYTFSGWNGTYGRVISDVTITAEYEINVYKVKFYQPDGVEYIGEQDITFDEPIDIQKFAGDVKMKNGGYGFKGWNIIYAKESDSYMDTTHVDSDMNVCAVTAWANEDLPAFIEDLSISISYGPTSKAFDGYNVSFKLSTTQKKDQNIKIIVTQQNDLGNGVYKMVNAKVQTAHFDAATSLLPITCYIANDGSYKADRIEVSAVAIEGSDRTGGIVAESKSLPISEAASVFWSEWMTEDQLKANGLTKDSEEVEAKTQYRSRKATKKTVQTTSSTPPAGYTYQSDNSYWGAWSGWGTTAVSGSATRQVETSTERVPSGYTEYRYGQISNRSRCLFDCMTYAKKTYGGTWNYYYSPWSTTRYYPNKYKAWYCDEQSHSHPHKSDSSTASITYWDDYLINGTHYYWEETQWIDTSWDRTIYRYRDYNYLYTHYLWDWQNWSDYQDSPISGYTYSNEKMEVQSRIVYRYKMYDASKLSTDTEGTVHEVKGSFEEASFSDKKALVMVYKSKNTDPTESQLEYVGQTTLGENGSYNISFVAKEEMSYNTSDFMVAFAVEGSDNLFNVHQIRYERDAYTVIFEDENGIISEQQVYEGNSAEVPEAPEKEGYDFAGWSRSTANVKNNVRAYAKYNPKSYCVAFTDYLNQTCTLTRADFGSNIVVPEDIATLEHEGYRFDGWNLGEHAAVDGDMVITPIWTPQEYRVTFYDSQEKVIETQKVTYGQSAKLPAPLTCSEDLTFLGWSEENEWWNVTKNMDVKPIIAYKSCVAVPTSNVEMLEDGLATDLELYAEEGATIYYTLDGSIPSFMENDSTKVYEKPIQTTESLDVCAVAYKNGCQASEIVYIYYAPSDFESDYNTNYGIFAEDISKDIVIDSEKEITLDFSLNKDIGMESAVICVDCDPSVFSPMYDADEDKFELTAGELCQDNGYLSMDMQQTSNGLYISWIGTNPTVGTGKLFSVKLSVDGTDGKYPMHISHSTVQTYGENGNPINLGSALEFSVNGNDKTISIDERDQTGYEIDAVPDQFYTGKAIQPKVVIHDNGVLLTEGKDYKLSYKNNTKVNDAQDESAAPTILIKGCGNYSENTSVTFKILPVDFSLGLVTCEEQFIYKQTGAVIKPVPTFTYNGKKLVNGRDFDVKYLNAGGAECEPSKIGNYYIEVIGKGSFAGTRKLSMIIASTDPMSKAVISPIKMQEYTGAEICPTFTVKLGGKQMTEGSEYAVDYRNNIDAGTATVIISGIGDYYGEKKVSFKIKGISLSGVTVKEGKSFEFTGKNITPEVVVTAEGKTLTEGDDYTVAYSKNKNVGTATVMVTGKGKYSGTKKCTFAIKARELATNEFFKVRMYDAQGNVLDDDNRVVCYEKNGATPKITVVDVQNSYTLVPGQDYKVTYKNHNCVTEGTDKTATVTITGMKNYTKNISVNFKVKKQDISVLNMILSDIPYSSKAGKYKSNPVIVDLNGQKLTIGKDYDRKITYTYKDDVTVNGKEIKAGTEVGNGDIVPVDTVIKVTVKGIGCYADSEKSAEYRITRYDMKQARAVTKDQVYTGKQIKLNPEKKDIKVTVNGRALTYGVDYEISSYSNNVNKGTATVTIRGIGNYGGTKQVNFKIGSRNILWWII